MIFEEVKGFSDSSKQNKNSQTAEIESLEITGSFSASSAKADKTDFEQETTKAETVDQQDQETKEENSYEGGDKMSEELELQEECTGCEEGCPNSDEEPCPSCEPIDFCCTLVIPDGFFLPGANRQYIRDNFDLAAYLDLEDCIDCRTVPCSVTVEGEEEASCNQVDVTQIEIQGCIKLIGGLCVQSRSGRDNAAEAPVCCQTTVCIDEYTPVCLGCNASCNQLRVVDAEIDFESGEQPELIGDSCGDQIWEITGTLEFACVPCNQ